jgi:ribosome-binding factor A
MRSTPRSRKMDETVREAIALIVQEELSDPRLEIVTVTSARVAPDMSVADVFVTAHGDEERYAEVLAGLESARGRIRSLLGRAVQTRLTPELRFHIDESVDEGMRITEALKHPPTSLADSGEDARVDAEERE